jgi:hypothetical protein
MPLISAPPHCLFTSTHWAYSPVPGCPVGQTSQRLYKFSSLLYDVHGLFDQSLCDMQSSRWSLSPLLSNYLTNKLWNRTQRGARFHLLLVTLTQRIPVAKSACQSYAYLGALITHWRADSATNTLWNRAQRGKVMPKPAKLCYNGTVGETWWPLRPGCTFPSESFTGRLPTVLLLHLVSRCSSPWRRPACAPTAPYVVTAAAGRL